jgi:hypothetical protein
MELPEYGSNTVEAQRQNMKRAAAVKRKGTV